MNVKYFGEEFPFEPSDIDEFSLEGFLRLNEEQEEKMDELFDLEFENESWALDENGERLDSDALFAASPWSMDGPNGEVKLLRRFYSADTGAIRFSMEEGYPGELFRWVREQSSSVGE